MTRFVRYELIHQSFEIMSPTIHLEQAVVMTIGLCKIVVSNASQRLTFS
jgi:hypothetical protein